MLKIANPQPMLRVSLVGAHKIPRDFIVAFGLGAKTRFDIGRFRPLSRKGCIEFRCISDLRRSVAFDRLGEISDSAIVVFTLRRQNRDLGAIPIRLRLEFGNLFGCDPLRVNRLSASRG